MSNGKPSREVCVRFNQNDWRLLSHLDNKTYEKNAAPMVRLLKGVYGLKDAPRAWRRRLHQVLVQIGGKQCSMDNCVYTWYDNKKQLALVMSTHVDDLKVTGTYVQWNLILPQLEKHFGELVTLENSFEHCGIIHSREDDGTIVMNQTHYAATLKVVEMDSPERAKNASTKVTCSDKEYEQFRSVLGALAWLTQTRPDISIYVAELQRVATRPTTQDCKDLNTTVRWAKSVGVPNRFKPLKPPYRIVTVADSNFCKESADYKSVRGYVTLLMTNDAGLRGTVHVLDFGAKKHKKVTKSTYASELWACVDSCE